MPRHPLVTDVFAPAAHIAKGLRDITQASSNEYYSIKAALNQLKDGLKATTDLSSQLPEVQDAVKKIGEIVKGCSGQIGYDDVVLHLRNSELDKHAKAGMRAIEAPRYAWDNENAEVTKNQTDRLKPDVGETSDQSDREPKAQSERVSLFGQGTDPSIDGKPKDKLTTPQYDVIQALIEAGAKGLNKDELVTKSGRAGARAILTRLCHGDSDWKSVIQFAGKTGGGYRIQ